MTRIKQVTARQISDSRGNPTVEARVYLESGNFGWSAVPSGASRGEREAIELRDEESSAYRGKAVLKAVSNVNTKIDLALRRQPVEEQHRIDEIMLEIDASPNKRNLGANAMLAVSLAAAAAAAKQSLGDERLFEYIALLQGQDAGCTLPVPMINVLNGGQHADNHLCIQEFMIVPIGAESLWQATVMACNVFRAIGDIVERLPANPSIGVGDEGGYSPILCPGEPQQKKVRAVLDLVLQAMEKAGLRPGEDVVLALDAAASEFSDGKSYHFYQDDEPSKACWSAEEMIAFYETLVDDYPIRSIEDGLSERDEDGWILMTQKLGDRIQIVGDDLFVTNPALLQRGIDKGMANSILIKPNQIGTLSETLDTISLAKENGYTCVVSHRSGETLDTKIADIAVGCNTGQIKTGSMSRGERIAKYNRLKDIEISLGTAAKWPALPWIHPEI